jgi:thiol-disulfide isomerase/thioredoxin
MSQIQQLTVKDFTIYEHQDASKTRNLVISIKEPAVLLYYSTACPYCQMFWPVFEQTAKNVPRFRYCALNADKYKNVAISSLTTTTPIRSVPYIVTYNNGKAMSVYTGPKKYDDFLDFLKDHSKRLEKQSFNRKSPEVARQRGSTVHSGNREDIISYKQDLGVPYNVVCGSGQCYLTYDQIYEGGSADTTPDSCYLSFNECYGQECKVDEPIQRNFSASAASGMGRNNNDNMMLTAGMNVGRNVQDIVRTINL